MDNKKTINPHLPQDIIEEILKNLPVKTLLRFQCVSKSWRALISSPEFVKSHLKNSSTSKNLRLQRVIFQRGYNVELYDTSLHSLLYEPLVDDVDFDHQQPFNTKSITLIVGSCNGLVCVLTERRNFILWNPSTRKSKNLPDMIDDLNLKPDFSVVGYGFGYDESSDDYKVFAVAFQTDVGNIQAKVYSSRRGSWKTIHYGDKNFSNIPAIPAKFAGGKLYWSPMETSQYAKKGPFLEFFDLENEVFGEIKHPHQHRDADSYSMNLRVFDGCICVCYYTYFPEGHTGVNAWVLREEEYWEEVFSFSYSGFNCGMRFCFCVNGEIVLSSWPNFTVYNLRDRSFRYPEMLSRLLHCRLPDVYVESLVSLDDQSGNIPNILRVGN